MFILYAAVYGLYLIKCGLVNTQKYPAFNFRCLCKFSDQLQRTLISKRYHKLLLQCQYSIKLMNGIISLGDFVFIIPKFSKTSETGSKEIILESVVGVELYSSLI